MKQPAASLYRKFLDHIHPQLPLSVRESNRLLAVLKSTFNKRLDLEHPFADPVLTSTSSPPFAPANNHMLPANPAASVSSHTSASQHLDRILSHPLFNSSAPRPPIQRLPKWQERQNAVYASSLTRCLTARQAFELSSDKNVASVESAMELMSLVLQHASKIENPKHVHAFVRQTEVRQTVLHYLRERHMLTTSAITQNPKLFQVLLRCLVADGRTTIVERWITNPRILASDSQHDRAVDIYSRRWLLDVLLRAETQQLGLQMSVRRFSWRLEQLEELYQKSTLTEDEKSYIVQPALTALAQSLTDSPNGSNVNGDAYDKLISSLGNPVGDSPYLVHLARLKLYHPTKPDASSMLDLLQTLDPVLMLTSGDWAAQLKTLVQWAVDASKLLSRQGDSELADRALKFARRICIAAKVDWDELLRAREANPHVSRTRGSFGY